MSNMLRRGWTANNHSMEMMMMMRRTTPSMATIQRRAFAKVYPEYPEFSVDKNNWVEKNEIVRENKYKTWRITQDNVIPLVFMLVAFPLFVWHSSKEELTIRDKRQRDRKAAEDML